MENKLVVTSSPHASASRTVRGIMLDVVVALLFPSVASVIIFGYRAALLITVSIVSCALFEFLYCKLLKKPSSAGDLSAVVTGMLLALNVPVSLPVWMMVVGAFAAIVIVKMLFGGIGCNFVNPALAGRVVLTLSFGTAMTTYGYPTRMPEAVAAVSSASVNGPDMLASATPLSIIEYGHKDVLDLWTLLLGNHGGVLGETCALALLLGGIYMVVRGVITPVIPLTFIGTTVLFSWIFGSPAPVLAALSGGLFLGAIFMATDYATSPYTNWGRFLYAFGCGLLTALIRAFATSTEGVTFAILIMNLLVPYINDLTRRKPFGTGGAKHA